MYIRFSTVDEAEAACDSINAVFVKRGHTNPVCEVCYESYLQGQYRRLDSLLGYWYVREIPILMPV